MYLFCFNVPESHLEQVKEAVFNAGAGKYGNYSHCSWQTLGESQFKPLPGSHPYIGEVNKLTVVKEYKVETVCDPKLLEAVIAALKAAHPYEAPSYQAWKIDF